MVKALLKVLYIWRCTFVPDGTIKWPQRKCLVSQYRQCQGGVCVCGGSHLLGGFSNKFQRVFWWDSIEVNSLMCL